MEILGWVGTALVIIVNDADLDTAVAQVTTALTVFACQFLTLLEVTDSSLPIVQQEIFGPVRTMQIFDTEAEAVSLANDSEYGLAATVWSRDVDRPLRVARALQAGTIWINDWAIHDEFEEGGFKQSGPGRLRGQAGLDDFLERKHIAFKPGPIQG